MPAEFSLAFFVGALLLWIRIGTALRFVPFFGGYPVPVLPWLAFSLTLGVLLAPHAAKAIPSDLSPTHLAALAVGELFVGVVIGALIRMAFAVFEVVGEVARVSSFAVLPAVGDNRFAAFYLLLGICVFLLIGGHHALIRGLTATIQCVPPSSLSGFEAIAGESHTAVVKLFATAMATAVLVSAPIFIAGLFADILIGLLARFTTSGMGFAGAQALRVIAVQLVVVASLGFVVTRTIRFLETGVASLSVCLQ